MLADALKQRTMLAAIFQRFIGPRGDMASHGTARFTIERGELAHEATEISLVPSKAEEHDPDRFVTRVLAEAAEGDQVELRMRDGRLVSALIIRRAALPLQIAPGETFEAFALRVRHFKDAPRA